jgi:hypothetical protein
VRPQALISSSPRCVQAKRRVSVQETMLEVVALGAIASPMFAIKGPSMIAGKFPTAFPLKHQQKVRRRARVFLEFRKGLTGRWFLDRELWPAIGLNGSDRQSIM